MQMPIVVGAVLYDPKVSLIWDIIRDFFAQNGCPIDVVFYTNYERQVHALKHGHIDIAWNSPLAWVQLERETQGKCRAIAMRDTDQDRVSHLVVPSGSEIHTTEDLRGKTVAVGAADSPQATLIPIALVQRAGLVPGVDFQVQRFDVLVGKHGDHVGGELQALQSMMSNNADACAMLDLNWNQWTTDGTINPGEYRILATTDPFDHCVFAVREDFDPQRERQWLDVLFSMSYDNPQHREMMDLEGLRQWMPGRKSGFGPLSEAVEGQAYFG
ncbi:MAG: phosphate/phosphite/phosphonate ABC transporter substrate-binding protein [Pirellulaceae bacterium]